MLLIRLLPGAHENAAQLVEHPVRRGIEPLHMLLRTPDHACESLKGSTTFLSSTGDLSERSALLKFTRLGSRCEVEDYLDEGRRCHSSCESRGRTFQHGMTDHQGWKAEAGTVPCSACASPNDGAEPGQDKSFFSRDYPLRA